MEQGERVQYQSETLLYTDSPLPTSESEYQIDILTVRMVPREKFAQVKLIENVIFE